MERVSIAVALALLLYGTDALAASVLNRTTKQYLVSVNTPDYPTADWIIEPDLSAVTGFDSRYWTITGDAVTLKTLSERNAVDAALLELSRDATAAQVDDG